MSHHDDFPKRPYVKGKAKRHVITVRQEVFDQVVEAQAFANDLNEQASAALPFVKKTRWTLSEILAMALKDWMDVARKVHQGGAAESREK